MEIGLNGTNNGLALQRQPNNTPSNIKMRSAANRKPACSLPHIAKNVNKETENKKPYGRTEQIQSVK